MGDDKERRPREPRTLEAAHALNDALRAKAEKKVGAVNVAIEAAHEAAAWLIERRMGVRT